MVGAARSVVAKLPSRSCTVDDVTRLLSDLVAIPSVNPMGRPLVGRGFLETRLTDYLEAWFRELGVDCRAAAGLAGPRQPAGLVRGARLAADDPLRRPSGHRADRRHDDPAVRADDRRRAGSTAGARATSRGAMAAMLVGLRPAGARAAARARRRCSWPARSTRSSPTPARRAWRRSDHGAELAIVAEPTSLNLVHCHKGALRWKIRTRGRRLPQLDAPPGRQRHLPDGPGPRGPRDVRRHAVRDRRPHPILGPPSLSVGRIEGGQSVNVVPDWCEIEVDRRLIPGEDAAACLEDVESAARASCLGGLDGDRVRPALGAHAGPRPAGRRNGSSPWATPIAAATGRRPEVLGVPFGTDAGPLSAAGTPCVVFGPGDIAQAHTKDEWIDLEQVQLAAEAYYQIACDLGDAAVG